MIEPSTNLKDISDTPNHNVQRKIKDLREIVKKRDNELLDLKHAIKNHLKLTRHRYKQLDEDQVVVENESQDIFSTLKASVPTSQVLLAHS